jgi:hypothetical protein
MSLLFHTFLLHTSICFALLQYDFEELISFRQFIADQLNTDTLMMMQIIQSDVEFAPAEKAMASTGSRMETGSSQKDIAVFKILNLRLEKLDMQYVVLFHDFLIARVLWFA